MAHLEITTNVGCRIRCLYCPQDKFIKAYLKRSHIMRMSFSTFKRCIDKLPKDVEIHFSGFSEPFLNKECARMILYAHEQGFRIWVFTTGVGMSVQDVDLIKKIPFETFSIHLPNKAGKTRININRVYLRVIEKLFKSSIKNIVYGWPGAKGMEGIHPKLKALLKKYDVPKSEYMIVTRAGNVKIGMLSSPKKIKGVMPKCKRLRCGILLPNGDVTLCTMDWGLKHVLGNLLESDYGSLFKGKEFKSILKGLEDDSSEVICRYCDCAPAKRMILWRIVNLVQRKAKRIFGS